ncbi:hypothetical protein GXP69_06640 [Pontibacter sp. BT327]|uniref:Uncharacterized protein n=1 Tax=Pontibacter burrus TaxID=2704466 RepID=A0A6B3LT02_9BACT|nr:hypothetical protein [Pontibacter burrus]
MVDDAHAKLESFYPEEAVYKNTPEWIEKRRLLLADLALHLAQDALKGETINQEKLKHHLFAILKISKEFFPEENYGEAALQLDKPVEIR